MFPETDKEDSNLLTLNKYILGTGQLSSVQKTFRSTLGSLKLPPFATAEYFAYGLFHSETSH